MSTPRSASDPLSRSGTTGPSVSLAQLRAANVRIEWFEAVAVVAALCQSVAESSDERRGLTGDNVFVFETGSVAALVAVQAPGELVRQAAVLLGELLPDFHRRVSFHELLTTAQASPPGYASLDEFSRALAPFERPGRDGIVRELYQRGAASVHASAPVYTASFEPAALDRFVSERTLRPETTAGSPQVSGMVPGASVDQPPQRTPPRKRKTFLQDQRVQAALIVVLAIAVIAVCGWLLWSMWFRPASPAITAAVQPQQVLEPSATVDPATPVEQSAAPAPTPEAPAPPPAAAQASAPLVTHQPTASAAASVDSNQVAHAQPGDVDLPSEPPAAPRQRAAAVAGKSPTAGVPAPLPSGAASAGRQPNTNVRTAASGPAAASRPAVVSAPPPSAAASAAGAQSPAARVDGSGTAAAPPGPSGSQSQPAFVRADDASRIYTVEDREVTPPALTASQQLWRIPASPRPEDSMRVEVVVDEDGSVVSVKSVDPPASVADAAAVAMSLSAAKSWHFRPAIKDGRPVRYRQIVAVSMR
jgi:hypothetical protein